MLQLGHQQRPRSAPSPSLCPHHPRSYGKFSVLRNPAHHARPPQPKEDDHARCELNPTPTEADALEQGKLIGAKPPLLARHVWSIRTRLQIEGRTRDLAMFNLAIDSKLRGCDVVAIRVEDIAPNGYALARATVRQRKTGRPVRFELTEQTRQAVDDYLKATGKVPGEFLFTSRRRGGEAMTTRQYARLVAEWVAGIGLDPHIFSTHSLRRTKATLIYRRMGNLRAVQLLLRHTKMESTVRYLGIEVDDALAIAEQVEV
jgi:integrase